MSATYDQKPVKARDNFPPVTVTHEEFAELVRTGKPFVMFRKFLESKGIIHKRGIHVESWTPEGSSDGTICYRNYRQKTDCQIAGEEDGMSVKSWLHPSGISPSSWLASDEEEFREMAKKAFAPKEGKE